jgi:hypothetical protein
MAEIETGVKNKCHRRLVELARVNPMQNSGVQTKNDLFYPNQIKLGFVKIHFQTDLTFIVSIISFKFAQ